MNCGFSLKQDLPLEIPAGATQELVGALEVVRAGEFGAQIHLYLDDLGLREILLSVEGTAGE